MGVSKSEGTQRRARVQVAAPTVLPKVVRPDEVLATDASGALFAANENVRRARRADDVTVAQPAQLRVLSEGIVGPPPPAANVDALVLDRAAPPILEQQSFLRSTFESLAPKTTRATLRFLNKNVDAWLGVWHVLNKAVGGVDASYFILERDIFGMSFLGGLLSKAMQGDPVRLLVDSAGDYLRMKGFTLPTRGGDYLQELVEHGAEVRIYNPMHKKLLNLLFGGFRLSAVANNHDKLVRSKTMAETGGRNLAADYQSDPDALDEPVYRDTCVLIESEETSKELEVAFEREFYQEHVTFKQFKDLFGNWRKRDGELIGAYCMMDGWVKGDLGLSRAAIVAARTDKAVAKRLADRLVEIALERMPAAGCTRKVGWLTKRSLRRSARQLVNHTALYGSYDRFVAGEKHEDVEVKVLDRLSAAANQKRDQLTHAIRVAALSATKSIRIHNPYVTLSEEAIACLEQAGRRGVKIELLTNSPASTDNRITQALFLEDWPRLAARIPNLSIFVLAGDQKLHAKSIEVDDVMTFVKSYNLDLLSECVNSELGIVAWSKSFAKAAGHAFDGDLSDPRHNVVEYRIERDAQGRPVYGEDGEPKVAFGAKDHIPEKAWRRYGWWRSGVRWMRKLPLFRSHQRPALPAQI